MKKITVLILLAVTLIGAGVFQASETTTSGSSTPWGAIGATVGGAAAVGGLGYKAYQWRQLYKKEQEENAFFNASKKQYDATIEKLRASLKTFQDNLDVKVVAYLKESNAFFYKSEKLLEKYTALQSKIQTFLKSNFKSESAGILFDLEQCELAIEKRKEELNIERTQLFDHFKGLLTQLEKFCGDYLQSMNKQLVDFDRKYLATLQRSNTLLAQEGEDATGEYLKMETLANGKIAEYEAKHDSYLTRMYKRGKGILTGAKQPVLATPVLPTTEAA